MTRRFSASAPTLMKVGKRVLLPLLTVTALGYAFSVLLAHGAEFVTALQQIRLDKVGLAALAFLASTSFIALAWIKLIKGMESDVKPKLSLWRVHACSWLARYLPGKIIAPMARIQGGYQLGYSMGTLLRSSVYENVAQIPTALLIGSLLVMASGSQQGAIQWIFNIALIVSVVMLAALILVPSIPRHLLPKWARSDMPTSVIVQAIVLYSAASMLGGAGVIMLIHDVNSLAVTFYVMGAVILSGVVGIAFSITPAGIGVRESILTAFLAPVLGAGAALSVAIVARVLRIVTDFIFCGLCYVLDKHDHHAKG
jgi:uncharacterized membrane protein YbhN (UPF0104 family)